MMAVSLIRAFLRDHRRLALFVILCALFVKAFVPTGYMFGSQARTFTVEFCAEGGASALSKQIVVHSQSPLGTPAGDHGKSDGGCAFSALSMAGLAGADTLQLAAAIAFILVLGFAAHSLPLTAAPSHIRPPLRGPPVSGLTFSF